MFRSSNILIFYVNVKVQISGLSLQSLCCLFAGVDGFLLRLDQG